MEKKISAFALLASGLLGGCKTEPAFYAPYIQNPAHIQAMPCGLGKIIDAEENKKHNLCFGCDTEEIVFAEIENQYVYVSRMTNGLDICGKISRERYEEIFKGIRTADSKSNCSSVEDICKGYQEFMSSAGKFKAIPTEITDKYKPTKEQVLEFSRTLVRYKDVDEFRHNTAHYLTALMHSSKDTEFEIDLTELNKAEKTLLFLGYGLQGKTLTINGDAGSAVGFLAEGAHINLNGNTDSDVGLSAKNSHITVNGNAGFGVGEAAENSHITVNGNAGIGVGIFAKNCKIRIRGAYESLSEGIGEGTEICQMQKELWCPVNNKTNNAVSLDKICKGYEEFMNCSCVINKIPTEITDRYKPTKEQVLEFSRTLVRYKDLPGFRLDTANYLTAMMHSSKDTEFVIDITELNKAGKTLDWLGLRLQGKTLTINGNAGSHVGSLAEGVRITVNGNAGSRVGFFAENSKIYIRGTYEEISDKIGQGTEVYQQQNGQWVKAHPK